MVNSSVDVEKGSESTVKIKKRREKGYHINHKCLTPEVDEGDMDLKLVPFDSPIISLEIFLSYGKVFVRGGGGVNFSFLFNRTWFLFPNGRRYLICPVKPKRAGEIFWHFLGIF